MEVFINDLYKDHLTGLENFFSFMQCNFSEIFGTNGVVLIIDIANFLNFNNKHGKNNGDLYLKCISEVLCNVLSDKSQVFKFRTHGDEFTCVFPNQSTQDVKNICDMITKECKIRMTENGFGCAELHTLILKYENEIGSLEEYYKLLVKNSINQSEQIEDKFCGERFLRHIIDGITNRVRDTLSYYKDAYNFAMVDDVSGLANHRAGKMFIASLLEEYKINNLGFSILFIDGDNLKRYNEISYESGNEMIRRIGQIITSSIRNDDRVYRWLSGDEFVVVLKGTNEANALKLADRIRAVVEEQTREMVFPTTVSIGVASYPNDGLEIEELIRKAEKANAFAKNSGKNKVVKYAMP